MQENTQTLLENLDHESEPERTVQSKWGEFITDSPSSTLEEIPYFSDLYDCFCILNVFTENECQVLIDEMEKLHFGKTNFPKKYRGNLRLQSFDSSLATLLWKRIAHFFPENLIDNLDTFQKCDLNTKWRCAKYYPGNRFQEHVDASYFESYERCSFYTVNIYLNDGFGDGQTRLYHYDENNQKRTHAVEPEAGMALVFRQPPTERLLHDGAEVTSGVKYLLRTDAMYNKLD